MWTYCIYFGFELIVFKCISFAIDYSYCRKCLVSASLGVVLNIVVPVWQVSLCCYCHTGQNLIISFWKWGTLLLSSYCYHFMEVEECLESLNFTKWDETCDQNAKERVICTWFLKLFLFGFRLFRIALSQKCKVKVLYFLRCKSTFWNCLKLYMTQNFKSLPALGRAFKAIKNGVYSIVITFLVAALFKILIYAN